jgi:hypothetical protein
VVSSFSKQIGRKFGGSDGIGRALAAQRCSSGGGYSVEQRAEMLQRVERDLGMWSRLSKEGELSRAEKRALRYDLILWAAIKELA